VEDNMLLVGLLALAVPIGVSYWTWQDAKKRNMNTRWAIGVGLLLIVFLPLYLLIRKPVKCSACGKEIPASLSLCEECEQLSDEQSAGRAGRIFG
jgi:hypothetical protein